MSNKDFTYCDNHTCPLKEDCKRYVKETPLGTFRYFFTESPGRYCDVLNGGNPYTPIKQWVCDKKLNHE